MTFQPSALCAAAALALCLSGAAVRAADDLTPIGAPRAASGAIPAWTGHDEPKAGWAPGKLRGDAWQFRDEKPIAQIDAGNAAQHAAELSPGQLQMFRSHPTYRMPVYPTHRDCAYPAQLVVNTQANKGFARTSADGDALEQAKLPGVPFPQPANGAQAMWNFQTRYQGVGVEWPSSTTVISPGPGSSNPWIVTEARQHFYFPWGKGSNTPASVNNELLGIYLEIRAPAALAGQALMGTAGLDNKPMETFYYFPGQRRVRRLPTYAYDAPQIGFENQYTVDQTLMFTGNLDRFDWKLVGKRELLVPYDSFGLFDFSARREDMEQPEFINPSFRRYELHRVWVVEGTVKSGARHLAPRKVFYLDEDSWQILVGEDYDVRGELWKVRESSLIPAWELEGACVSSSFVQYDLANGRYVQDFVTQGSGQDVRWHADSSDTRFRADFFTSDRLRSISER